MNQDISEEARHQASLRYPVGRKRKLSCILFSESFLSNGKKIEMEKDPRENALAYILNQLQGVKHFRDAQEKLKKSIYDRGFFLCKKVREKLGSKEKFVEFLKQLHLYSNGKIDLTEFLNLVDDGVQADQELMNEIDAFLEHCEKEQMNWSLG